VEEERRDIVPPASLESVCCVICSDSTRRRRTRIAAQALVLRIVRSGNILIGSIVMNNDNPARLVRKSEIDAAIKLWDSLSPEEVAGDDPFGGQLGRSGASAYNFLLLATASRTWMETYLEEAVKRMKNHKNPGKVLSKNVGHIKELTENPARRVGGVQPLVRVNERLIQVNPQLLNKIEFIYVDAALTKEAAQ
jgi:hypothetical protein